MASYLPQERSTDPSEKMNPEVKAEWVKELRSGKYVKGVNYLNTGGTYCCLGVLSELAVKHGVMTRIDHSDGPNCYRMVADIDRGLHESYPPAALADWAGGEARDGVFRPSVEHDGVRVYLDALNDRGELSFNDIADLIEEQL